MNTLEPSNKIKSLRTRLYAIRDKRQIDDALAEIQREAIALEMQADELRLANESLIIENYGVAEMRASLVELKELLAPGSGYHIAPDDPPGEFIEGIRIEGIFERADAALAAPNVEVPF